MIYLSVRISQLMFRSCIIYSTRRSFIDLEIFTHGISWCLAVRLALHCGPVWLRKDFALYFFMGVTPVALDSNAWCTKWDK